MTYFTITLVENKLVKGQVNASRIDRKLGINQTLMIMITRSRMANRKRDG